MKQIYDKKFTIALERTSFEYVEEKIKNGVYKDRTDAIRKIIKHVMNNKVDWTVRTLPRTPVKLDDVPICNVLLRVDMETWNYLNMCKIHYSVSASRVINLMILAVCSVERKIACNLPIATLGCRPEKIKYSKDDFNIYLDNVCLDYVGRCSKAMRITGDEFMYRCVCFVNRKRLDWNKLTPCAGRTRNFMYVHLHCTPEMRNYLLECVDTIGYGSSVNEVVNLMLLHLKNAYGDFILDYL